MVARFNQRGRKRHETQLSRRKDVVDLPKAYHQRSRSKPPLLTARVARPLGVSRTPRGPCSSLRFPLFSRSFCATGFTVPAAVVSPLFSRGAAKEGRAEPGGRVLPPLLRRSAPAWAPRRCEGDGCLPGRARAV
jgi:hypothetical protein